MRHVLIALLLMASKAHAENWLQVANLDSNGGVLSIDTASVDRGGELQKAWFKSVYTADRPIGSGYRGVAPDARSYRWESILGHFNCAARTIAVSQSILHGADDQVVGTVDVDQSALKFREVAPQSIGGLMLEAVCGSSTTDVQPKPGLARVTHVVNPDDYYPSAAKRRGEQGSPIVKVCVAPSGALLREPEITGTSGFPDLDRAAIKAAKAMRFAGAVEDGTAAPESCVKFKVKFGRFNH
jgi:TonB family protein